MPARKPPWKCKNPRKRHSKLTDEQKQAARARASRAGRRYPNLIDNMWAASGRDIARPTKKKVTKKARKTSGEKKPSKKKQSKTSSKRRRAA